MGTDPVPVWCALVAGSPRELGMSPPHAAEHEGVMLSGGLKKIGIPSICIPPGPPAGRRKGNWKCSCASNSSFSTCPLEGPAVTNRALDLNRSLHLSEHWHLVLRRKRHVHHPIKTPNLRNLFHVLYCQDGWHLALQHHWHITIMSM